VLAAAHEATPQPPLPREVLVESSFRAGRDGLEATVWHDGALEEVDRIVAVGNGADRMRAAHAEGGMPRVLRRLIEESAEPLGARASAA
jgi:carboxylate-amine ligase